MTCSRARYAAGARAAVATGASGKIDTRHVSETRKCGSFYASFLRTHPPEDFKKQRKKKGKRRQPSAAYRIQKRSIFHLSTASHRQNVNSELYSQLYVRINPSTPCNLPKPDSALTASHSLFPTLRSSLASERTVTGSRRQDIADKNNFSFFKSFKWPKRQFRTLSYTSTQLHVGMNASTVHPLKH